MPSGWKSAWANWRLAGLELDGHGGSEDGQAFVQANYVLFVQPEQGAVHQPVRSIDSAAEQEVFVQSGVESAQGGLGQQVGASGAGGQGAEQVFEQSVGRGAAQLCDGGYVLPLPLQGDLDGLPVAAAQGQAAPAGSFVPAVGGDAVDQSVDQEGQGLVVALAFELLGDGSEVQKIAVSPGLVGSFLLHQVNERCFQLCGLAESAEGGISNSRVYEGGQGGVVAGNTESLQVVQGLLHLLGVHPGGDHQLVGGYAFVGVRLD